MKNIFETNFYHNSNEYENWYENSAERANEDGEEFNCNTEVARHVFAEHVITWINDELGTSINYCGVNFPKDYTFDRDSIKIDYSLDDVELLKAWVESEHTLQLLLRDKIEGYTTTTSGYTAFHSEGEFLNSHKLMLRAMLELYCELEESCFSNYFDIQCVYDSLYNASVSN